MQDLQTEASTTTYGEEPQPSPRRVSSTSLEDAIHVKQEGEREGAKKASWAFFEALWLVKQTIVLVWQMGWGVLWILRLVRMLIFTTIMAPTVMRVMWYYMNSPTIVRRIAYRKSEADGEQAGDMGSMNNRAYLDLHLPVHTVEVLRARFRRTHSLQRGDDDEGAPVSSDEDDDEIQHKARATILDHHSPDPLCATYSGLTMKEQLEIGEQQGLQGSTTEDESENSSSSTNSASGPMQLGKKKKSGLGSASWSKKMKDIHILGAAVETAEQQDAGRKNKTKKKKKVQRHAHSPMRRASSSEPKSFPVIVCITGGAWIIGAHYWGIPLSRLFADNGYLCVCPDYRNFPQATVSGMVQDVTDAIAWVMDNIEDYGGDPKQITLLGQSAGAHLMMQSIVEQVELLGQGKKAKFDPRLLHRVVGLSGLYNLDKVKPLLHSRGLHTKVQELIFESNHRHFSPTLRIEQLSLEVFDEFFPTKCSFIHGVNDASAPWQESDSLAAVLQRKIARANKKLKFAVATAGGSSSAGTVPFVSGGGGTGSGGDSSSLTANNIGGGKTGLTTLSRHSSTSTMGNTLRTLGTSTAATSLNGTLNGTTTKANQAGERTAHLYLMPEATHTSPYVDDPIMQKSQVVEIICTLDDNPEPKLGIRCFDANPLQLAIAAKFMAF